MLVCDMRDSAHVDRDKDFFASGGDVEVTSLVVCLGLLTQL
jgi:hypothetical protein